MLVVEETADSFNEGLNLPFDRILMLVTRRGRTNGDPVMFEQVSGGREGVLGSAGVAPEVANAVTMLFVEVDDVFGCLEERGAGFVVDEDSVTKTAKEVLEEEEAGVAANRGRVDESLIIDADGVRGQETVDAGAKPGGIAISLCESACRAVDMGHDFVDDRGS